MFFFHEFDWKQLYTIIGDKKNYLGKLSWCNFSQMELRLEGIFNIVLFCKNEQNSRIKLVLCKRDPCKQKSWQLLSLFLFLKMRQNWKCFLKMLVWNIGLSYRGKKLDRCLLIFGQAWSAGLAVQKLPETKFVHF